MILLNSKMAPVGSTSEERSDDYLFTERPPILTTRSIGSYLSEERSDDHLPRLGLLYLGHASINILRSFQCSPEGAELKA